MKKIVYCLSFFFAFELHAQDTVYAKKIIADLCSPKMAGRGYVNKGDKKAANYIKKEFVKLGLKKANSNSYYQPFSFPVNTFPKTVEVEYNGKKLIAGVDFIINADCNYFEFDGEVDFIQTSEMNDSNHYDFKGFRLQNVIIDTLFKKNEKAAINWKKYSTDYKKQLIIKLTNDKLTYTSSYELKKNCLITLKSSVFNRDSKSHFKIKIVNKFYQKYTSQNVIGMIEGTTHKDSFIVFTAHYDHLGKLGKTAYFPGANDNASGVAMMLNLAKYFSKNPQKYSLLFIAFSGEETGLIGSQYYVRNPIIPLENMSFLINIDLMGNGAEGVMAVNGSVYKKQLEWLKNINDKMNYLPQIKVRGKAANSDHYYFSEAGVPCFFFYLMGNYPYYHDVFDKPSNLPLTNYSNAFLLFRDFIIRLQN